MLVGRAQGANGSIHAAAGDGGAGQPGPTALALERGASHAEALFGLDRGLDRGHAVTSLAKTEHLLKPRSGQLRPPSGAGKQHPGSSQGPGGREVGPSEGKPSTFIGEGLSISNEFSRDQEAGLSPGLLGQGELEVPQRPRAGTHQRHGQGALGQSVKALSGAQGPSLADLRGAAAAQTFVEKKLNNQLAASS